MEVSEENIELEDVKNEDLIVKKKRNKEFDKEELMMEENKEYDNPRGIEIKIRKSGDYKYKLPQVKKKNLALFLQNFS